MQRRRERSCTVPFAYAAEGVTLCGGPFRLTHPPWGGFALRCPNQGVLNLKSVRLGACTLTRNRVSSSSCFHGKGTPVVSLFDFLGQALDILHQRAGVYR